MENAFKGDWWCLQNYEWSTTTPGWEKYLHSMSSRSRPNPYSGDIHTGRRWMQSLHWTRRCLEWNPAHRLNTENIFGWQILMCRKKYLRGAQNGQNLGLYLIFASAHLEVLVQPVAVIICATKLSLLLTPAETEKFYYFHASWNREVLLLFMPAETEKFYSYSRQLKQKGFAPFHASWNRKILFLFTPTETKKLYFFHASWNRRVLLLLMPAETERF